MTVADPAAIPSRHALSYPNFTLFFVGSAISNIGTWFQMLAESLLILHLTRSGAALGIALTIQTLPLLLFGSFIGPLLDRIDLRRLMLAVSVASGAEALTVGLLISTGRITVGAIYGLCLVLGLAQMFLMPATQTIISELVPATALPSAVSYASVQQTLGRLAGPALAALVYAWAGAAVCYYVNALSYAAVVAAVLAIRGDRLFPRQLRSGARESIRASIAFIWRIPPLRIQLTANAVIGTLAFNFSLFYSSFTQLVLHRGSLALGIAESLNALFAAATGAVLARSHFRRTLRTYCVACLALGATLMLVAVSPNLAVFLVVMALFGVAVMLYGSTNQTVLQTTAPRDRIGSVMTLSTMGSQGTTPIGALLMGWIISAASARVAIGVGAAGGLLVGLGVLAVLVVARRTSAAVAAGPELDATTSPGTSVGR